MGRIQRRVLLLQILATSIYRLVCRMRNVFQTLGVILLFSFSLLMLNSRVAVKKKKIWFSTLSYPNSTYHQDQALSNGEGSKTVLMVIITRAQLPNWIGGLVINMVRLHQIPDTRHLQAKISPTTQTLNPRLCLMQHQFQLLGLGGGGGIFESQ